MDIYSLTYVSYIFVPSAIAAAGYENITDHALSGIFCLFVLHLDLNNLGVVSVLGILSNLRMNTFRETNCRFLKTSQKPIIRYKVKTIIVNYSQLLLTDCHYLH